MAKVDKPEIGAELYAVFEHLYSSKSAPGRALKEYCVCKGTVRGFYTGSYTDVCMLVPGAGRIPVVKLLQTGGHRQKAVLHGSRCRRAGRRMTEKFERIWGWIGGPEFPWPDRGRIYWRGKMTARWIWKSKAAAEGGSHEYHYCFKTHGVVRSLP